MTELLDSSKKDIVTGRTRDYYGNITIFTNLGIYFSKDGKYYADTRLINLLDR